MADHRRHQRGDQTHVVEEGQPAHPAVALLTVECLDDLNDVGGQVEVGDLHTRGDARRTRGVLQVGNGLGADVDVFPGDADIVGHGIDRDDAGTLLGGAATEELPHPLSGVGCGQNRRRLAVVEHGVQAADVAGFGRIEQRHRDAPGVEGAEERDHVLEVLRTEDGDAIAGLGDLLQPGGDCAVTDAEVSPVQVALNALALGGEVHKSVRKLVPADLRPLLDVPDHAAVVGKPKQSVLEERVVERHLKLLFKGTLFWMPVRTFASGPASNPRSSPAYSLLAFS